MRTDIQALRGLAVLIVVAYHARLVGIENGFLGVDMFFVISGYLISRQIIASLQAGTFSLGGFYLRRARRLLPALYAVLLVVTLYVEASLTALERQDYYWQLLGAVTYSANLVLWQQSGYFDGAASLKPLLHVWSLSLEEQFYLIAPLALILLTARRWFGATLAGLLLSAGLCLAFAASEPAATFYLLPTRAWELLLGTLLAVMSSNRSDASGLWPTVRATASILALPLAALAAWSISAGFASVHPGIDAVVVCVATAAIIAANPRWVDRNAIARGLARVGDASYSLYLIHWPILSLALAANMTRPLSLGARWIALLASLVLAALCYRYIEQPFRKPQPHNRRFVGSMLALSGLLLLMPLVAQQWRSADSDWAAVRLGNVGFDWRCDFDRRFEAIAECRNSDEPQVIVWGDSVAIHWVPGLTAAGLEVVQATKSVCGPDFAMAPLAENYQAIWAERCHAFNQSVRDYLANAPSIRYAVLGSTFALYRDEIWIDGAARTRDLAEIVRAFAATIDELRRSGLKVVVMAPLPNAGSDLGQCLELAASGQSVANEWLDQDCSFDQALDNRNNAHAHELLRRLAQVADVDVVWPAEVLCADGRCRSEIDGVPIYRDSLHLSYPGSVQLVRALQERKSIVERAR